MYYLPSLSSHLKSWFKSDYLEHKLVLGTRHLPGGLASDRLGVFSSYLGKNIALTCPPLSLFSTMKFTFIKKNLNILRQITFIYWCHWWWSNISFFSPEIYTALKHFDRFIPPEIMGTCVYTDTHTHNVCTCTNVFVKTSLSYRLYGIRTFWESDDIWPALTFWHTFIRLFEA